MHTILCVAYKFLRGRPGFPLALCRKEKKKTDLTSSNHETLIINDIELVRDGLCNYCNGGGKASKFN